MYLKEFEIRWSDIDANRHLANSSYLNFMSHTRMSYLIENGFGQKELSKHNIGPVVFYEHIYYFKEILAEKPVKVSLELKGLSENGMFFEFLHNIYDHNGKNCARCEMMGSWIDLETRKLIDLPEKLLQNLEHLDKTEDFKVLTKEDTRKYNVKPEDLKL
ncbi:acyl-CoA thioesterase [Mesonia maritima]|uniref:Acyl-CoA thioester hydrolase n=1 Tax=Mesonia maritima TaxID=1793873 RepID=A0ABU1K1Z0_9FLAO|nr:thioesterase family protein [Mesonia maritima]MDR6299636.1 acyl-CoA thioester hydrolase [Mesonia maritima]